MPSSDQASGVKTVGLDAARVRVELTKFAAASLRVLSAKEVFANGITASSADEVLSRITGWFMASP